jgi:hypothetical protein
MPNKLVNVGLHLQWLKFGEAEDPTKPHLGDNVKDDSVVKKARQKHITDIGVKLTYAENRALFAVQKLLDDTGFRGNARPVKLTNGNPYKMTGSRPVLEVKISEYLDAYGVRKGKSYRHIREYSVSGRKSALAALESLAKKSFLLAYTREVYDKKKRGVKSHRALVETVDHLVAVKRLKRQPLVITPSPILFDQYDTYYMILPADLYTGVVVDKQRSLVLFIEYLFYHYEKQRAGDKTSTYLITRHIETIAHAIGLGHLITSRQRGKLRATLSRYYELAVKEGYLRKYEVDAPGAKYALVDKLYINAAKMGRLRQVQEKSSTEESNI